MPRPKPIISNLPKNSRMVLIGKTDGTLQGSAICSGLSSLTRSLSKEIGRNGSTVNIIFASPTVLQEPRTFAQGLVGPLSFFLLPDSAFCTGQELSISSSAMSNTDSWRGAFGLSNKVAVVTGAGRGNPTFLHVGK